MKVYSDVVLSDSTTIIIMIYHDLDIIIVIVSP